MGFFSGIWEFFNPSTPGTVGYEETQAGLGKPTSADKADAKAPVYGPPDVTAKWFGDPYDYHFYMTLPKSKWLSSMGWLSRKLYADYSAGRFTQSQMASIKAYVKSLGFDGIGSVVAVAASEAGKAANTAKDIVTGTQPSNGGGDPAPAGGNMSTWAALAVGFVALLVIIKR